MQVVSDRPSPPATPPPPFLGAAHLPKGKPAYTRGFELAERDDSGMNVSLVLKCSTDTLTWEAVLCSGRMHARWRPPAMCLPCCCLLGGCSVQPPSHGFLPEQLQWSWWQLLVCCHLFLPRWAPYGTATESDWGFFGPLLQAGMHAL